METNISRMWNFEAHQKEQRAVKKLNTDLLDGMSPMRHTVPIEAPTIHSPIQFIATTCYMSLMRMQFKISRH